MSTKSHPKCPRNVTQKMSTKSHPKRGLLVDKSVHEMSPKSVHEKSPFDNVHEMSPILKKSVHEMSLSTKCLHPHFLKKSILKIIYEGTIIVLGTWHFMKFVLFVDHVYFSYKEYSADDTSLADGKGWRHFVDSDILWTLFFKMGNISWTLSKGDFSWTLFGDISRTLSSTRSPLFGWLFVDIFWVNSSGH